MAITRQHICQPDETNAYQIRLINPVTFSGTYTVAVSSKLDYRTRRLATTDRQDGTCLCNHVASRTQVYFHMPRGRRSSQGHARQGKGQISHQHDIADKRYDSDSHTHVASRQHLRSASRHQLHGFPASPVHHTWPSGYLCCGPYGMECAA